MLSYPDKFLDWADCGPIQSGKSCAEVFPLIKIFSKIAVNRLSRNLVF